MRKNPGETSAKYEPMNTSRGVREDLDTKFGFDRGSLEKIRKLVSSVWDASDAGEIHTEAKRAIAQLQKIASAYVQSGNVLMEYVAREKLAKLCSSVADAFESIDERLAEPYRWSSNFFDLGAELTRERLLYENREGLEYLRAMGLS